MLVLRRAVPGQEVRDGLALRLAGTSGHVRRVRVRAHQFSQPGEYRAAAESFVIFWPFSSLMTVESVFFSVYAHLYGRASLISAMSCVP